MNNFKKISKTLLVATALTGVMISASAIPSVSEFTGSVAVAQQHPLASPERQAEAQALRNARPRLGSIPGVGERAGKILKKVSDWAQEEPPRFQEVYNELKDEERRLDRWNDTEKVAYYQLMAQASQNLDNMDEALAAFKAILGLEKISNTQRDQFTYIVGQIEFSKGNYAEAIRYIDEWFKYQPNPSITQIEFLGNVQYTLAMENEGPAAEPYFRKAIELLNWAITKAKAEGKEDKENWYQVLRAMHNTLNELDKVEEYAELLTSRWPKKQYWVQLSSVYSQLATQEGRSDSEVAEYEKKQLAAFEMAHRQGMLDTGREFETMAQLYLYHESPYQSSKVMGQSLADGKSEKTRRNLELYSTGLVTGKDYEEAVGPLAEAAALSDDGNMYFQLANVYLNIDKYAEAAEAIDKALAKGGLRRPDQLSILQGQAYLALEDFDKARESFREAAKDERSEAAARNFIRYVDSEEKRIREIREYLS